MLTFFKATFSFHGVLCVATKKLFPISSAVLTFIGHKQTEKQSIYKDRFNITSDEPLYRHDSGLMNESKPNQTENINSVPSGQQGSISVELIPGVNKRLNYRVSLER